MKDVPGARRESGADAASNHWKCAGIAEKMLVMMTIMIIMVFAMVMLVMMMIMMVVWLMLAQQEECHMKKPINK